jgi:hypothetical protein
LMQEGDGRLPLKTKHLIFCLLDVAFGNHKGRSIMPGRQCGEV